MYVSERRRKTMNVLLIVAGAIGILAAGVHGVAGEILVVRKLSPERLATSPFGGARMTRAMIHVTWHITTVAFLVVGCALVVAGAGRDPAAPPPAAPPPPPRACGAPPRAPP